MAGRAEFLQKIRRRTRAGHYRPTLAPDSVWTPASRPREPEQVEDPPVRFLRELEAVGGHGFRAADVGEARERVLSIVRERGAKSLVRWDAAELDALGVDGPLREAGIEVTVWRDLPDFRRATAGADVGLSTADWAIAETGSLVLSSGPGRGRTVTLLPPTYVAVLPESRVLGTVAETIGRYAGEALPSNVCFHTGPSRSGDIEMSLVTGMHGPGDVSVVLLG
jgi:L-lactate utilization protein LutC